eukprot:CAMPEP_0179214084 /NCGR_PEP_ID=MMETSP0797-20121207/2087_1 /TAXON_ID=47934 /ORGANISM="Dinophysis acuminata, Strain DAEP01" /LENGTH=197 /DNA_ID=CAMNT_0020920013 /DNA_START=41 /DNA_END=631 /DNA_ORIENTATION=+
MVDLSPLQERSSVHPSTCRVQSRSSTYNNDEIWKWQCDKELDAWAKSQVRAQLPWEHAEEATSYKVPVKGEQVMISGTRNRPELNGARGEVLDTAADASGRITVRVYDHQATREGGSRKMKIQARHVLPMRSSSTPLLRNPPADDGCSSVRTCSRAGSVASSARAGARGSVLSASGRDAVSAAGSFRALAPWVPAAP